MIVTENLTLDGTWQEVTKEFDVHSMSLNLDNVVRSFQFSSDSGGAEPKTIEKSDTLVINEFEKNIEQTYYVQGTSGDTLEIIKQR